MEVETKNLQIDFGSVAGGTTRNGKETRLNQPTTPSQAQPHEVTREERKKQVEELIKEFGQSDQVTMRYDSEIDRVIVTVTDGKTNEVVKQIPSRDLISFLKNFDRFVGLMVDRRV